MHTIVCCRSAMVDLTKLALFKHYTTLCKHSTNSAITFTALRNVNTTTRTDNLSSCLLVVDSVFDPRTVQPVASRYTVYAIPASSLNMWSMKLSRAKTETVIRTELNVCSIWFVAATLQLLPFLLMTT